MRVQERKWRQEEEALEGQLHAEDGKRKKCHRKTLSERQEPSKFPGAHGRVGQAGATQPGMGFLHREYNLSSCVPDEPDLGQVFYFPVLRRKTRSLIPSHLEFFGRLIFLAKTNVTRVAHGFSWAQGFGEGTFRFCTASAYESLPLGSNTHLSYIRNLRAANLSPCLLED